MSRSRVIVLRFLWYVGKGPDLVIAYYTDLSGVVWGRRSRRIAPRPTCVWGVSSATPNLQVTTPTAGTQPDTSGHLPNLCRARV